VLLCSSGASTAAVASVAAVASALREGAGLGGDDAVRCFLGGESLRSSARGDRRVRGGRGGEDLAAASWEARGGDAFCRDGLGGDFVRADAALSGDGCKRAGRRLPGAAGRGGDFWRVGAGRGGDFSR